MTTSPAQPQTEGLHAATTADEQRLGELVGDRACAKCFFNLSGQSIVREALYGLLIVRCPECGTPAALQEYPVLGRWAPRLGYAIVGAWLLVLLGSLVLAGGLAALISYGTAEELTQSFQTRAYDAAVEHIKSVKAEVGPPSPTQYYGNEPIEADWWTKLPPEKFFADAGGWGGALDWYKLFYWAYVALVGGLFGIVLAVAIPRRGWIRPMAVSAAIVSIGLLFLALSTLESSRSIAWGGAWMVKEQAFRLICWPLFAMTLAMCWAVLVVGQLVGRRVARLVVRVLLPPRCWPALAFLWRADGLAFPKPPRLPSPPR